MSDETTVPDADLDEDTLDDLLEEAETSLSNLEDRLGDESDIADSLDDDLVDSTLGDVETIARVASAAIDLLETVDLSDLPEAVDEDELLEGIETGEIPAALVDEETDVGDAVEFQQLFRAIDLLAAFDATDLATLWGEADELEDAVGTLAEEGDEDDAGLLEETASAVSDGDEPLLGDDEGEEDSLLETDLDLGAREAKEALGAPDPTTDPEAYQVFIQQQAMEAIDAVRWALLEAHEKFERLVEYNRERTRRRDRSSTSRNPTAASTMPTHRSAAGTVDNYSTVPQDVRLSTAPSRKRIYGDRFARERERRREENEEREADAEETTRDPM
ncbi:hypothetical protein [Natrarchaeobaculum aegyptiacum]|uniref:Uncharacterized protein n=1 Tax=Natrarchaeobaculum aegyptiacum TaxID=745377 RepID=A0A2Z2HY74_9EURY|nr:hypothetical protein [Natrarchaeobaculum aegyptiacum]ARS88448.1 hypothetical protein B1756_00895 [Natrarchaeobaculum aegyptiacum]